MVAAAKAEEKERERVQEEIGEVAQHMLALLPLLEDCSNPSRQQVRHFFCALECKLDIGE